jgi:hypothetical protein
MLILFSQHLTQNIFKCQSQINILTLEPLAKLPTKKAVHIAHLTPNDLFLNEIELKNLFLGKLACYFLFS